MEPERTAHPRPLSFRPSLSASARSGPWTAWTSAWSAASPTVCWAPTAPVRPRPSGYSAGFRSPTRARRAFWGGARIPDRAVRYRVGYIRRRSPCTATLRPSRALRLFGEMFDLSPADTRIARADELPGAGGARGSRRLARGTFSGGKKRRLSLACAMMHRPSSLLDEPTVGVDPELSSRSGNTSRR